MDTDGCPGGLPFLERYTIKREGMNLRTGATVSSTGNGKTPEGRGFL
jgi:hypothetical protein